MSGSGSIADLRVAVTPGSGRIARRGRTLLFVPADVVEERPTEVDDLFKQFARDGPRSVVRSQAPRCIVDWSSDAGHVVFDSSFALWVGRFRPGDATGHREDLTESLEHWLTDGAAASRTERTDAKFVVASAPDVDPRRLPTDMRDGDAYVGGFAMSFDCEPSSIASVAHAPTPVRAKATTESPPLVDLDDTLAPMGPITYPDDDTDRTFRRPGDRRCPRGHAIANTTEVCRVCAAPLGATASRAGPRASTAIAGLRLPDGDVIAINRTIVVGRSPSAEGARMEGLPRLVTLDAPESVSRTHVVVALHDGQITVTDCDSRGRTAVIATGDPRPLALTAWQPLSVAVGDVIKLGGPTALTIAHPDELRAPPALEPTESPPERDETI